MKLQDILEYLVPCIFVLFWAIRSIFEVKNRSRQREEETNKRQVQKDEKDKRRPTPLEETFGMEVKVEEAKESYDYKNEKEGLSETAMTKDPGATAVKKLIRDYEAKIEKKKQKIKEAREAPRQALSLKSDYGKYGSTKKVSGVFADEVISMLKTPHATKKAMLSYEILGTPVSMREREDIKMRCQV